MPASYIPQLQHSLVDVIAHSYGIVPGARTDFLHLAGLPACVEPPCV